MSAPYPWPVSRSIASTPCARSSTSRASRTRATHSTSASTSRRQRHARLRGPPGKVFIEDQGHALAVQAPDGRTFGYWHVVPAVAPPPGGRPAPAAWPHRGALGPRALRREHQTAPTTTRSGRGAAAVRRRRASRRSSRSCSGAAGRGRTPASRDACRSAASPTTRRRSPCRRRGTNARHAGAGALPDLLRRPLHPAAARRRRPARLPQPAAFHDLRPGHAQNHPSKPGHYCYVLAHDWNSAAFANASTCSRWRPPTSTGTSAISSLPFTIRNGRRVSGPGRGARRRPARGGTRASG